jgi:hypothetical protein
MINSRAIRTIYPIPPCQARHSAKANGTHIFGSDPLPTHANTMVGWKRRVVKGSGA